jgi:hypothetical protein
VDETDVINLRLARPEDLFQTPDWDATSSQCRFEPGVEYCLSELRSRRSRAPVRLELEVPAQALEPETPARLRHALTAYCEERIGRNNRERRIARRDAYSALKIGLPVALVGLIIAVATAVSNSQEDLANLAGWVLAWVGLWYPLDVILFSSVGPKRENAVLSRLLQAEVTVRPR